MNYPNVADLSSAQRSFDAALYAASRQAVIIKSTESTSYHFAQGDTWERQALAQGLTVGRYHWAGSSLRGTIQDPDVEGDFFLRFNGKHTPGRFAACDMENPLPGHGPALYGMSAQVAAAWVDVFLNHIADQGGWPGFGYSFLGTGVVQRIRHAKWYAAYPGPVPTDRALHQYSSSAPVSGVGSCDDSHCYIDLRAFAGASTPTPHQEDDMSAPIRIPEPTTNSPRLPDGRPYEKGTVATAPGTKGLIRVSADGWPDKAPVVRVAIGSGRPDGQFRHKHPDAGIHDNVGIANWPADYGYDHSTPFGQGFDEQAGVLNYGPGDVTLTVIQA